MDENEGISVPIELVLEEAKNQRNGFLDQLLLLKAYIRSLEEKNRMLEEKINSASSFDSRVDD